MQIDKKKIIIIGGIILALVIAIVSIVLFINVRQKKAKEFYYEFKYDDNLISQSVWIYNGNNELQTNYYIFYNDEPVSHTEGEKAVLTMLLLDLKDHPTIQIRFKEDVKNNKKTTYDVKFKEE